MRTVYTIGDNQGRVMNAEVEDGHVRVTMNFYVEKDLTIDDVFTTLGWTILDKQEYEEPKVIPFTRKET